MQFTNYKVDQIIYSRCLPEDYRSVVVDILKQDDADQIEGDLDVVTGHCYRFDPNHPRYDKNRAVFPN